MMKQRTKCLLWVPPLTLLLATLAGGVGAGIAYVLCTVLSLPRYQHGWWDTAIMGVLAIAFLFCVFGLACSLWEECNQHHSGPDPAELPPGQHPYTRDIPGEEIYAAATRYRWNWTEGGHDGQ